VAGEAQARILQLKLFSPIIHQETKSIGPSRFHVVKPNLKFLYSSLPDMLVGAKEPWFRAFACFCGVNSLVTAKFKQLMSGHS
jgi:hypothetical protein